MVNLNYPAVYRVHVYLFIFLYEEAIFINSAFTSKTYYIQLSMFRAIRNLTDTRHNRELR